MIIAGCCNTADRIRSHLNEELHTFAKGLFESQATSFRGNCGANQFPETFFHWYINTN